MDGQSCLIPRDIRCVATGQPDAPLVDGDTAEMAASQCPEGRLGEREYTQVELEAIAAGIEAIALSPEQALSHLGEMFFFDPTYESARKVAMRPGGSQ